MRRVKFRNAWLSVFTMTTDLVLIVLSLLSLHFLAGSYLPNPATLPFWVEYALPVTVVGCVVLYWRQVYRIATRYLGFVDFLNIAIVGLALFVTLTALGALNRADHSGSHPLTPPLLFAFIACAAMMSTRVYYRLASLRTAGARSGDRVIKRTVIVGAGDAGETILREASKHPALGLAVLGFVDDSDALQKSTIQGVPVLGRVRDIPAIVEKHEVDELLLAMPSAKSEDIQAVYAVCSRTSARIRILPSFPTLVRRNRQLHLQLRDLNVEDLLRRESVQSDRANVSRFISGERVLITGAGGSIGSELARQVAQEGPSSLVLLGHGENSIFEIDQELKHSGSFQSTPVVCDVRDRRALRSAMATHYPSVVFHAAAHKHVPLMEHNPIEAIRNNVFGTLNVVEESVRNGVKHLVFISTDKAVNPTNVMGATKRVAEQIVAAYVSLSETNFSVVRFGNVLGSRGSLVPLLQKQIKAGGPITITHPEMSRYFMTIGEAVDLVLQAGALQEKGGMFVLEMGKPVSILNLAKDMVRMHGLVLGKDIELRFTGARPGEKLHEELASSEEALLPCSVEKIKMVANSKTIRWTVLNPQLVELRSLCDQNDAKGAHAKLMEIAWGKNLPLVTPSAWVAVEPVEELRPQ